VRNQPSVFQHSDVFGHRGQTHLERFGQGVDRRRTVLPSRKDRAARRVGEGCKGRVELGGVCQALINKP